MILFILLLLAVSIIVLSYYSLKWQWRYFTNYILTGKIFETFSKEFLMAAGFIFTGLIIFVQFAIRGPKYLEQCMDQLHKNNLVADKIGNFSSYSYQSGAMPKDPKDTAVFQIQLNGDDTLFLTCTMKKIGNDWKLSKMEQDSIHKTR